MYRGIPKRTTGPKGPIQPSRPVSRRLMQEAPGPPLLLVLIVLDLVLVSDPKHPCHPAIVPWASLQRLCYCLLPAGQSKAHWGRLARYGYGGEPSHVAHVAHLSTHLISLCAGRTPNPGTLEADHTGHGAHPSQVRTNLSPFSPSPTVGTTSVTGSRPICHPSRRTQWSLAAKYMRDMPAMY